MSAYVIVEVTYHDPGLREQYQKLTPATIAAYDGRFIVRGGSTTLLEGDWKPERVVVIEFPSVARAEEWWRSAEYSLPKSIRQSAADTKMIIVEGLTPNGQDSISRSIPLLKS